MLVDRVGQLHVLVLGEDAVVDDLAIGRVLVELGGGVAQIGCRPEGRPDLLALVDDALLLEPFGEQDEDRDREAQHQDGEHADRDEAALLEGGDQAVRIGAGGGGGWGRHGRRFLELGMVEIVSERRSRTALVSLSEAPTEYSVTNGSSAGFRTCLSQACSALGA